VLGETRAWLAAQDQRRSRGSRNGNYNHGRYTAEAIYSRQWLRRFTRDVRAWLRDCVSPEAEREAYWIHSPRLPRTP
jgi:hypothetical protein